MADFLVIKIDKNDGSTDAPRYVTEIVDDMVQMSEVTSGITLKWEMSTVDQVDADELANAFYKVKIALEKIPTLNMARVYVDVLTI